jgi:hypothetical protein
MNLVFDADSLRELVRPIVEEVAAAIGSRTGDEDRLAYLEADAAKLLGIASHQLRDARLRGEITSTRVGGRIGYERTELLAYLARNRRT